jgi:Ca2+-binding EF-hand superfamily protein
MQMASVVRDEVKEIFDRIDKDGDGSISFEEFARLMLDMDHARPHEELRSRFDVIDQDRDGRVSFEELRVWLAR